MSKKKKGQNKNEKGRKTKGDKKPNRKRRKSNKMISQKAKRGGEKTWQKDNKKEETEDQCSNTWIAIFHSLISNASFFVILQFFKPLFTDSSHVKFGRPLPLTEQQNEWIFVLMCVMILPVHFISMSTHAVLLGTSPFWPNAVL
jgi:hypothetical protein